MRQHLKHFFIPHEGNNYHPHILHTKRAIFYSAFFLAIKGMVFLFAVFLPSIVFVMPDVLAGEEHKLLTLTNNLRIEKGISPLTPKVPLHVSSDNKASEMADLHYFSHTSPNGYGLAHFLSSAGYSFETAGENLAMGFSTAEEIFSSWVKSPTHYANLIDPDFKEFGVAMESGTYNNLSTVYVAQHFGSPKVTPEKPFPKSEEKVTLQSASVTVPSSSTSTPPAPTPIKKPEPKIAFAAPVPALPEPVPLPESKVALLDVAVEPVPQEVHFVSQESFVDFEEQGNTTTFTAEVKITGDVQSATITLGTYSFALKKQDGLYRGTLVVGEPVNNFFKPIVEPSLEIMAQTGEIVRSVVSWKQIKIISPGPIEKYTKAKSLPGFSEKIFHFSQGVYLFFMVFFSLALILSIVIEFRRQHHHIIAQTLGLLVLLATLILT